MVTKDKWVTEEDFDKAFDRVEARTGINKMNANLVIAELDTKSRTTVYKLFKRRMAAEKGTAVRLAFTMPESDQEIGATMLRTFVSGVVDNALSTARIQIAALEDEISRLEQGENHWIAALTDTEIERNAALADAEALRDTIADVTRQTLRLEAQITMLKDDVVERMVGSVRERVESAGRVSAPEQYGPLFEVSAASPDQPNEPKM